jgi:FkbM family methyltransferase
MVDPSELSGFYLYYEREYDDAVFRFLGTRLCSFAWAIDLGANIGVYTTFIARLCQMVDAFEPDQNMIAELKRNLHLNEINNVRIHPECVSDVSGVVRFEVSPATNNGIGKIGDFGIAVPSIGFGEFLASSKQKPLFIKMDIEGAEWLAIKGCCEVLQRWQYPLSILMELHPDGIGRYGGSVQRMLNLLKQNGLTVWSLESGKLCPVSETSRFWWVTNYPEAVRI